MCEIGDVGDLADPVVDVAVDRIFAEADLDGSVGQRLEKKVSLRVPLDSDGRAVLAAEPLLFGCRWIGVAWAAVRQGPIEAFAGDVDGEDAALAVVFVSPTGTRWRLQKASKGGRCGGLEGLVMRRGVASGAEGSKRKQRVGLGHALRLEFALARWA